MNVGEILTNLWSDSGFAGLQWESYVMIAISCVLLYLGIVKKFEPLLLIGIAFGMLISNLSLVEGNALYHADW